MVPDHKEKLSKKEGEGANILLSSNFIPVFRDGFMQGTSPQQGSGSVLQRWSRLWPGVVESTLKKREEEVDPGVVTRDCDSVRGQP